jgi:hypothetical protein
VSNRRGEEPLHPRDNTSGPLQKELRVRQTRRHCTNRESVTSTLKNAREFIGKLVEYLNR